MKKIITISLVTSFLLDGMIMTAQVMTPEMRSKMLARAAELQLKAIYKAPPGDALSHPVLINYLNRLGHFKG